MSGPDNGGAKVEPPGRCNTCGEDVARERLFQKGQQAGVLFHRDRAGQPCGPVFTLFAYRVVVWIQPPGGGAGRPKVYRVRRKRPMEGGADDVDVARFLVAQFSAVDGQGALMVGVKPDIEVLFAQLESAS